MKEIEFQDIYINEIADTALKFLNDKFRDQSTIVFKAPTGSGKTYMISQALTKIVKQSKASYSFIWISVNTLHEQSRQNLSRYLEDERLLDCITIDEIQNKTIDENEIVFINWDSLIKENNIFRMDNESDWNLESVVSNTKEEGREIILIIDESHRTAKAEKAKDVVKEINPKLILEMTATPLPSQGALIEIPLGRVIDEGMIKREVQINPASHNIKENKELLGVALKKRKQLKAAYENIGVKINPLLLIQIPNKKATDMTAPEDYIIGLLAEHNITQSNGKLVTRLSGDDIKELDERVKPNDSAVDVLIFKEAIAVGWDCPRASILFLQREWKQDRYVFNIQTLGRIMRMPEQKHYEEKPELNIGYVFSASDNFEIVQELADDYASSLQMERDEDRYLKPVKIHSEFIRRKRELTRLSGDFKKCLFEAADELLIKNNINPNTKEITKSFAVEGKATAIDIDQKIEFEKRINIKKDIREVTDSYSNFCGDMSSPYAKARSSQIIKSSLRSWFKEVFSIADEDQIAIIVMQRNNNPKFKQLLEEAKEKYKNLPTRSEEVVPTEDWEVPETVSIFTDFAVVENSSKSIIKEADNKKLYAKKNKNGKIDLSNPELQFIEGLENSDDELQWWFKNSHGESKYFGIAYKKENGHYYGFYPDFIIKTKKEILIIEIKDNKDFRNADNALKLQAGRDYLSRFVRKEKLRFYILSPDDYYNFFQLLQEQVLDKFKSTFEEKLLRFSQSQKKIIENKKEQERSENDKFNLELLSELDKTINELEDHKLKNELLRLTLKDAQENVETLSRQLAAQKDEKVKSKIPTPFNICILGEVSDEELIMQELQKYFTKQGIGTNDWDIKFINNAKLKNSDVLRSLVKGQSRFTLIVTGQIHQHSGKSNKSANIITELDKPKYISHKIGSNPKDLLTPDKALAAVDSYLRQ